MSESKKAFPISLPKKPGAIAGSTPTLYLVRHGDTALNSGHTSPEKFRGHIDVPLSPQGKTEAQDLAKKLCKYPIDCVYSSDLSRAADTAKVIAEMCKVDCIEDERLRPWDLGKLAGTPVKDGITELKKYIGTPDVPIPGGESFNDFREDFLTVFDEIMDEAVDENEQYVVVAHTRGIQLTKASGAAPGGFANHNIDVGEFENYKDELHTGDVLKLEYSKGKWAIVKQEKA